MLLKRKYLFKYINSLIFLLLSIVMLIPFAVMISTSLKTEAESVQNPASLIPNEIIFSNFSTAMSRGTWGIWFSNSIIISAVSTAISLLLNSMGGYAYARLEFKGRNFLFYSMLLALMVPAQVRMVPSFIILRNFPLAGGNNIFGQGGTGLIDTHMALILIASAGAFGTFLCRQYFLNFPKSLDEAAIIDGCSTFGRYIRIYLPLSKPLFASLGVLKFTSVWNNYLWPLILTNTKDMRTVQLALAIFKNEVIEWNLLMAATAIITVPLIIIFLFSQRFFIEGIATSGIKG